MRPMTAAFAALAAVFALGSARAVEIPVGIANTMWECEGTAAAQYSIKGGGTLKSKGVFDSAPCDIWANEEGGQAMVGMNALTFPGLPEGSNSVMGAMVLDPGVFKANSVKVSLVSPENRAVIGELAAKIYALLSGHDAVVDGQDALTVKGVPPEKLGDLLIDPESIQASGTFVAAKKLTLLHATVTIRFEGVLTSGTLSGRTVKGKIVVKVKGVPAMLPGM